MDLSRSNNFLINVDEWAFDSAPLFQLIFAIQIIHSNKRIVVIISPPISQNVYDVLNFNKIYVDFIQRNFANRITFDIEKSFPFRKVLIVCR